MDDDKCAMCGKPSPEGRLYCSDGCRAADQGLVTVVGSQPLGTSRPPPINTYSYPRRTSHSADISTSDLDSSAASSSSAAARTSSPPSSPGVDDDDDDEDDDCSSSVFFSSQQRRPSLAAPPLPTMRLSFARRPSQTNSRTMVPLLIPAHGHGHRRHASLADSRVTAAAKSPPPPPSSTASAAVPWRLTPVQAPAATPVKSPSSPRDSTKPSRSIPASFSRILSGASPLQPLVTITNVDSSGLAALTIPASLPLDRSASQATVRVGRSVAARPLFAQQLRPAPEDSAADDDDSDVDRVVEPLRGRARTRTRRESTASGIDTIMITATTSNQLAPKQRTATLRRRDDASPRGSRSIPRRTAAVRASRSSRSP